jgi:predicted HTH domain antitoxin
MAQAANWTFSQLVKLQKKRPDLVDKALEQLRQADPEINWSLVLNAYLDEEINLGKAAELLGLHELELRERFIELGIPLRIGPADMAEARAEVDAIKSWLMTDDQS